MKVKTLSISLAAASLTLVAGPSAADPTVPIHPDLIKPKIATEITSANHAGVPGETKTLTATLLGKDKAPLSRRTLSFQVRRTGQTSGGVWEATTNAAGVATLKDFVVPEFEQANYPLRVSFAGDDAHSPTFVENGFFIARANTTFDFGDATWNGVLLYATVVVAIKRTSDNRTLLAPFMITVDGTKTQAVGPAHAIKLTTKGPWKITAEYAGSATYNPTSLERTYASPAPKPSGIGPIVIPH